MQEDGGYNAERMLTEKEKAEEERRRKQQRQEQQRQEEEQQRRAAAAAARAPAAPPALPAPTPSAPVAPSPAPPPVEVVEVKDGFVVFRQQISQAVAKQLSKYLRDKKIRCVLFRPSLTGDRTWTIENREKMSTYDRSEKRPDRGCVARMRG